MKDPPGSNPAHPAEKTITLTLTSPAPGQGAQQLHSQGPTGGIATPLIVSTTNVIPSVPSALGGLATVSSTCASSMHGPVSIHYAGSSLGGPGLSQCLPKAPSQNFVLGTGGPPLLVSGGTVLPSGSQSLAGLTAVGGASSGNSTGHGSVMPSYASSLNNPIQASLTKIPQQAPTTQSYVVSTGSINASNVCGPDSGDEGIPVSIHVTNNISSGGPGDPGSVGGPVDGHGSGQSEQRLKVEDALNYLDQVKYKFGNQPQVYNDFLDIMKEFKSQSIDTPGVISRVSHLFRGHPELIMGFNTFLPPGYKIEVQMNDQYSPGSMQHGINYKVTTVHTTGLLNQHSSTTLVQQHTAPSMPVRSTVTHTSHQGSTTTQYVGGGATVNNTVQPVTNVSITNSRAISPVRPPSLPSSGNNFETVGGSAFTHSLASPFVQNAFPTLQSQPVEFNHAITYVNKIKNRFHTQPDKYKQFLEILHTYQKEQRNSKDGATSKHLTEHEVYNQVAKLFENQEDLLQEFGQFLPDATPPPPPVSTVSTARQNTLVKDVKPRVEETKKPAKIRQEFPPAPPVTTQPAKPVASAPKRSIMNPALPSAKKVKYTSSFKDISLAEAGKYGTLNDFAFFDKVRHLLRSQEVYDNFLRILLLFNDEVISRSEVLQLVTPFLSRAPELLAWFKDFLGHNDQAASQQYEPVQSVSKQEKLSEEQVLEIDFSTCKRLGASYCALPKNHQPPKCSGRTALCKEVLNDVWVSFPTWSEDSTFVTSRKTQFEEYIYRCEDERFELDVVIETNTETIRCLEAVSKKMSRMSQEELQDFQLDDCLGGTSPTIHQRAIRRLYGEKASDIIEGLKRLPTITVPMVLKRLKAKEEEWREAQKGFNKIWREQIERFYLKSLDHQGINFKQGDIRALRSKALITEIETIYDERQEQNAVESATNTQQSEGPHLSFAYRDRSVLDDACNLLLHHVRRQSGIQKEDKRKIKQILKHFIPDLFNHPRMEMSDDEAEDVSPDEHDRRSPLEFLMNGSKNGKRTNGSSKRNNGAKSKKDDDSEQSNEAGPSGSSGKGQESRRTAAKRELKINLAEGKRGRGKDKNEDSQSQLTLDDLSVLTMDAEQLSKFTVSHSNQEENYRLFFVNNTWYVFLRLHQILCERLTKLLETATSLSQSEPKESRDPKNSAAIALRLKPKPEIEIEEYYPTFLEMVRNLLDGNMETNTYEDQLREMFGIHAYIAYTMDKVVANAVRQLQNLITDESCQKCLELYHYGHRRGGSGGSIAGASGRVRAEVMYQRRAEKAFGEENCVRVIIYQKNCEMTMELLDSEPPQPESEDQSAWFSYVDKYVKPDGSEVSDGKNKLRPNPLFLKRNRRKPVAADEVKKEVETVVETSTPATTTPATVTVAATSTEEPESSNVVRIKEETPEAEVTQHGSIQCSFNPASYKMVYVCDGEDYLYRNRALPRAKETHKPVSLLMNKRFDKWHEDWLLKNTTRKDRSDCEAWLRENPKNEADVRAKKIVKVVSSDNTDTPPYHQLKRYVITTLTCERH